MAYSSSNLRKILDAGIVDGRAVWHYRSTDPSSSVATTGYFARAGAGSRSPSSQAADNVGMKVGDIVIVSESTGGGTPGRTTVHSIIASTANVVGSTALSSNFNAGFDITISGT